MKPRKTLGRDVLLVGLGAMLTTGCDGRSPAVLSADSELTKPPDVAFAKKGTDQVLQSPARIARGEGQTAYVTDLLLGQVAVLDLSGAQPRISRTIDVGARVWGVAYADGRLFVGNVTDARVDIYDPTGRGKLRPVGSLGESVSFPTDIAIDPGQDLVFVLDGHEWVVKVFSLSTGDPLYHISGPGPGQFDLQNPMGITLDPSTSEIIVSDYGQPAQSVPPRIKIFTYAGAAVVSYSGKLGMLGQRFSRPQGVALNDSGHILLVDFVAGEIIALDRSTGATLATLGTGDLWGPLDLIADDAATAYVTSNRSGSIEVLDLGGLP